MIPRHIYDELLSLEGYLTYSPYAESRWLQPLNYLLRHVRENREREDALHAAALIADQVEAKAEPGHGKEAADEIGRRIRALMDEGR